MIPRAECRRIVDEVARERGLTRWDVVGPSHLAEHVKARVIIARRLRARNVPLKEIGSVINRHHASVMNYLGRTHRERPKQAIRASEVGGTDAHQGHAG